MWVFISLLILTGCPLSAPSLPTSYQEGRKEAVDWLHQGVPSPHTAVPSQCVPKGRTDLRKRKSFKRRSSRPPPCLLGVTIHVQTGQVVHGSAYEDSASLNLHPICTPKPYGFSPGCTALASWSTSQGHTPEPSGFSPGCTALASWSTSWGHVQIHLFS